MYFTAVLALAVLVGLIVGLAAYVLVIPKQQVQQQKPQQPEEEDEPRQVHGHHKATLHAGMAMYIVQSVLWHASSY